MEAFDRKGCPGIALVPALLCLMCLLAPTGARAQSPCLGCVEMRVERSTGGPGEEILLRLDVSAGEVPAQRVDAYLGVVLPDGSLDIPLRVLDWRVRDLEAHPLRLPPLESAQPGLASLYFVLARRGSDPTDPHSWLAADVAMISLLDDPGFGSAAPFAPGQAGFPRLISHGGGMIDGKIVSNSLEALNLSYQAGHRFFELDFAWTSDWRLVLIHDWEESYENFFSRRGDPPSLHEFLSLEMNYGLTQMDLTALLQWMQAHPDAWIVTDVKAHNALALRRIGARAGQVLHRFIPQVSSPDAYQAALDAGFANVVFTLYASAMTDPELHDFLDDHPVTAVIMPWEMALFRPLALQLQQRGIFLYAHTVNSEFLRSLLRKRGIRGIYSDILQ